VKTGAALADIEEALGQRGFAPCPGEVPTFGGMLSVGEASVRLSLSFPCLRFTRLPVVRLTHRAEDLPEAVAHIEWNDRLCYAAPGSLVLDMHRPGDYALTVLEQVARTLGEVAGGAANADLVAEFPQHWLAEVTVRLAFPPDAPEGMASLLAVDRLGAPPLLVAARKRREWRCHDGGAMGPLEGAAAGEVWVGRTDRELHPGSRTSPPSDLAELVAWAREVDAALAVRLVRAVGERFFAAPARVLVLGPNGCVGGYLHPPESWVRSAKRPEWWAKMLGEHPSKVGLQRWRGARMDAAYARTRNLAGAPSLAGRNIALIGCGTIGSHLARFLAQSGAGDGGRLLLVDPDGLEAGNLSRHWLGGRHVGSNKARACADELKTLSPGVQVEGLAADAMSRLDRLAESDLIIDATGEEALSRAVNAELVGYRPEAPDCIFVWLAGRGAAAQALFLPGRADGRGCLACHRPHGQPPVVMRSEADEGPVPAACGEAAFTPYGVAAPAVAAGLACRMALEWAGGGVSPSFRTLRVDLGATEAVLDADVPLRPGCPACGSAD